MRRISLVACSTLTLVAGCFGRDSYRQDQVHAIAVAGDTIVVGGGSALIEDDVHHGADQSVLFVSNDGGGSFERVEVPGTPAIDLAARGGVFVMVSHDDGLVIRSSTDGRVWNDRWSGINYGQSIAATADGFVVPVGRDLLESTDGVTWTTRTLPFGVEHTTELGDDLIVAYANQLARVTATDDGTVVMPTWLSQIQSVVGRGDRLFALAWTNLGGVFAADSEPAAPAPPNHVIELATGDLAAQPLASFEVGNSSYAMFGVPSGLLLDSGSLIANVDDLSALTPIAGGRFLDANVDGNRVALVQSQAPIAVRVSNDGGSSFGAAVALPVIEE
jgi:hypothetical protein